MRCPEAAACEGGHMLMNKPTVLPWGQGAVGWLLEATGLRSDLRAGPWALAPHTLPSPACCWGAPWVTAFLGCLLCTRRQPGIRSPTIWPGLLSWPDHTLASVMPPTPTFITFAPKLPLPQRSSALVTHHLAYHLPTTHAHLWLEPPSSHASSSRSDMAPSAWGPSDSTCQRPWLIPPRVS